MVLVPFRTTGEYSMSNFRDDAAHRFDDEDKDCIEDRDTGALDELHCDVCAAPIPYKQVHQLHFDDGDFWWLCRNCADERGLDDSALVELTEDTPSPVVRPWQNTSGTTLILGETRQELTEHDGMYYKTTTPEAVIRALNNSHVTHSRLHLSYGDTDTGRDWEETYDVEGYVGKTTGAVPIPILVYNKRSLGGAAILTDHIIKIKIAGQKGVTIYQHPQYHINQGEDPQARIQAVLNELQVQHP